MERTKVPYARGVAARQSWLRPPAVATVLRTAVAGRAAWDTLAPMGLRGRWSWAAMGIVQRTTLVLALVLGCGARPHPLPPPIGTESSTLVPPVEAHFLRLLDARDGLSAIDSGLFERRHGQGREHWQQQLDEELTALSQRLPRLDEASLPPAERAAVEAMRRAVEQLLRERRQGPGSPRCAEARERELPGPALQRALARCFEELGGQLHFETDTLDRASALQRLQELEDPARRKALFAAFEPLWTALHAPGEHDSPYRRLLVSTALNERSHGSQIDAASRALGVSHGELERWLLLVLEQWRDVSGEQAVEPWDFRYSIGEAIRLLDRHLEPEAVELVTARYFGALGADLGQLRVVYDLSPRPEKPAFAYTDFLERGRSENGQWQRSVARVVGPAPEGGLFALGELLHESAHAVHISAIKTRPAYLDWPDTLLVEAFADVPAWSLYEPAFQRRFLGVVAPEPASLRALHGAVALDVAWALFELRMLRDTGLDPNVVWTEITSRYLHIVPHPELSWWALRVQLVSDPGYMIHYGVGAILTAELRAHVTHELGDFDAGRLDWYAWLSERLLRFGSERDTRALMESLLGRPVSPAPLLAQLRRATR